MYEFVLSLCLYFVSSIAGSIYTQKFLRAKYSKKIVLFTWASLYFIFQFLGMRYLGGDYPLSELVQTIVNVVIIFILQLLLYKKNC